MAQRASVAEARDFAQTEAAPFDQGAQTALPSRFEPLAETARDYARAATSQNTHRAYAADWL